MKSLGRGLAALIPQKDRGDDAPSQSRDRSPMEDRIRVIHIPVGELYPNPRQPRTHFAERELGELAASIKVHGILEPLIVTPRKDGDGYELVAGERRLRASKLAGMKTVPAIVRSAGELEKIELALIENIQREDLNPVELAHSYHALTREFGLSIDELARRVGKATSSVSNIIRMLNLPAHIQKAVSEGKLGFAHAKAVLMLDTPELQEQLFQKIITHHMTSYEAEQAARDVSGKVKVPKHRERRGRTVAPDLVESEMLGRYLASHVEVYRTTSGGVIRIKFYSHEDFKRIMKKLLAGMSDMSNR